MGHRANRSSELNFPYFLGAFPKFRRERDLICEPLLMAMAQVLPSPNKDEQSGDDPRRRPTRGSKSFGARTGRDNIRGYPRFGGPVLTPLLLPTSASLPAICSETWLDHEQTHETHLNPLARMSFPDYPIENQHARRKIPTIRGGADIQGAAKGGRRRSLITFFNFWSLFPMLSSPVRNPFVAFCRTPFAASSKGGFCGTGFNFWLLQLCNPESSSVATRLVLQTICEATSLILQLRRSGKHSIIMMCSQGSQTLKKTMTHNVAPHRPVSSD